MTTPQPAHLLIATDLSDNSLLALHEGKRLAQALKARVTLVHCFDPGPSVPPIAFPGMEGAIEKEIAAAVTKSLTQLAEEHLADLPGVEVVALRGISAASTLCDYARENAADWIVVSTHGRTGLTHMLLGSVAEKIVRHAPCSVVVVR